MATLSYRHANTRDRWWNTYQASRSSMSAGRHMASQHAKHSSVRISLVSTANLARATLLALFLSAVSWFPACPPAFSEPVPVWSSFDADNSDLPGNTISTLASTGEGTLWVGTNGGLARVDKNGRWQAYTKANTNGGLPANNVNVVQPGPDGTIWIGTENGLTRLGKNGEWHTYTNANTSGGLPADLVSALAFSSDGTLWIGTNAGLARLGKNGEWQVFTKANTEGGLTSDHVLRVAVRADDSVWVGTFGGGLIQRDKYGRWRHDTTSFSPPRRGPDAVNALAVGPDGVLWAAKSAGGFGRLEKDDSWQVYTDANTRGGLPNQAITVLLPGPRGTVWIGTNGGGLVRFDSGTLQPYKNINTSPSDTILALAPGSDGSVWIGTSGGGLVRLDKDGFWKTYTKARTGGGMPSDFVLSLAPASNGGFWIGTFSGLSQLDQDGRWTTYTKESTHGALPDNAIFRLAREQSGALWIGTNGSGLVRLKDAGWQLFAKANTGGGLPSDRVSVLAPDPNGALWVGTFGGGLARLQDGTWRTYTQANTQGALPADWINALALSPNGDLWVGTHGGGLARLSHGGWETYTKANTNGGLPGDLVNALAPGPNGVLWIGTLGGGLTRRDEAGHWRTYTKASTGGGLTADWLNALTACADGALWIGTLGGGLVRFKDNRWETYNQGNTNNGLPGDMVTALQPCEGSDGSLLIGTNNGLGQFRYPRKPTHEIVDVIGDIRSITQPEHTVAVTAFDHGQLTQSAMFHYVWSMTECGWLSCDAPGTEVRTRAPTYTARFGRDGTYQLSASAIDRYGRWSEPRKITFNVALPIQDTIRAWLSTVTKWFASTGLIYFSLIFPLILLYPHYAWARTATNSGIFTKFPLLHRTILDAGWARRQLFRRYTESAILEAVPEPYIQQSLFPEKDKAALPLVPDGSARSLSLLFAAAHRTLLLGRSGTGKSVFLRYLSRAVGTRFLAGEPVPVPVLVDLRTHVLTGRAVQDLIFDTLRGGGIELSDPDLAFLIAKGGFLILVDSLNEVASLADAQLFNTFFNRDAHNLILIASQSDLIRRDDVRILNLAEVTPEQAAQYLQDALGHDVYSDLPPEAQLLARNPQDLALIAEVARNLGAANVPIHRAELYSTILAEDRSLRPWVLNNDRRLAAIYAVALRMITEGQMLQDEQLRDWISEEPETTSDDVETIYRVVKASRLFHTSAMHDVLGQEQRLTGFSHELVGKFLSARCLRGLIVQTPEHATLSYMAMSGDEAWLDIFYFVIDEIGSTKLLNRFLHEILAAGGAPRLRIAAYAIGTKPPEQLEAEVRSAYAKAKLAEDLAQTPAA